MSFYKRIYKLTALAVEGFGRPGQSGEELLEQVGTSVLRGKGRGGKLRKEMPMEHLKREISVTDKQSPEGFSGTGSLYAGGRMGVHRHKM